MPNGYAHVEKMTEDLTEKRIELVDPNFFCNDDLLHEILLRLPAESLLRFKCVSKHWHSIISSAISDPKFCANHTRINQKLSMFGAYYYFHRWELQERVRSVSFPNMNRTLPTLTFLNQAFNSEPAIIHAFKGLFVCWFGDENPLVVCNLTTQKFTKLPQHLPSISSEYHDAPEAFLHFDPKKSLHYKVVIIGWCYNDEEVIKYYRDEERKEDYSEYDGLFYRIDIYSSESKTWKRKHFPARWRSDSIHVALWNGAIHWETFIETHIRFEIDTETIISSPIPRPIVTEQHLIRYFGECCGRLFLIQILRHNCKGFNILEMDNDFCWNVKYRVDMMPLRTHFDEVFINPDLMGYACYMEELICWEFCVMCMVNEEKSDDLALLLGLPGYIISYDLKTGTFKVLQEFPESEFNLDYYNLAVGFHFIPTLSPT